MVISLTRELAKQINQTSIASDEQVLAMVISPTRELAKQINQTSIASGHLSHAKARQADEIKQALLLTSRLWRWSSLPRESSPSR